MQMSDPLLQRAFPSGARDTTINMVEVGPSFGGILPQEGVDDTGEVEGTVISVILPPPWMKKGA